MKKITILLLLLSTLGFAQVQNVTWSVSPATFEENQQITLTINGSSINETSWGIATSRALYIWAWSLDQNYNNSQDCPTNGTWGSSNEANKFTYNAGNDTYTLTFTPTTFFNRTTGAIGRFGFLVKAKDGNGDKKSQDIFVNVGSFQATLTAPAQNSTTILNSGQSLSVSATNTAGPASYTLWANTSVINTVASTTSYSYTHTNITANTNYSLVITQGSNTITKNFTVIVNPGTISAAMPANVIDGINYPADETKAILVLDAPGKDFVYVAGSFNGWQPGTADVMKKDPATGKFWLEISNLTAGQKYTYQYWVVDQTPIANSPKIVKTADPYSTLVLSPFDDPVNPLLDTYYPDLPDYPAGQEREVTVLQTGQATYNWQVTNFQKPKKEDLVIYEVLVRDFDSRRSYQDLIDKIDYFKNLKVNAIQLMPVMEFEGHESWGYNTSFHMAIDKAYGPDTKLKEFIDLCHQNGIAVILDIALNHAYGRNPMVRMWMNDPEGDGWGEPSTENPYFNTSAMHSYSVGSDFNHQQALTQNYVKRVVQHWIQEYNIDGFRWDLTKGFTQNCPWNGNDDQQKACTEAYHADRVAILKEYADFSWNLDPGHYVIFEHLGSGGSGQEETEWANYRFNEGKGIMLWGNLNYAYNQLTMGYADGSNINAVGHTARGFNGKRVVGYAESHDEERIMYRNSFYGNNTIATHNVRALNNGLMRMSALGAVLFTVPGPKMIWHFGELGWEKSIYTCSNGTVNLPGGTDGDCKLDTKQQPQWTENWMANVQRKKVYDDWAKMINLKISEPVFEGDYTITSGTLTPRITVTNNAVPAGQLNSVVVIANFNVTAQNVVPNFPVTGTWYNLMDNTPVTVTGTTTPINLPPGEFRIYGNQQTTLSAPVIEAETVALYPNPATDVFTLNTAVEKVEIYSVTGQLVKTFNANASYSFYDVSDLKAGIYLVKTTDTNNRQGTAKLVKK